MHPSCFANGFSRGQKDEGKVRISTEAQLALVSVNGTTVAEAWDKVRARTVADSHSSHMLANKGACGMFMI